VHPQSDRPWRIERHGIDPIPESDRHGSPASLFWIWFAANVSVLAVTYGGILVVFYRLNLWQTIVATVVGVIVSFLLVGSVSLAGKRAGAPTLVLSRAAFGVTGNVLPTLVSYVTLVGFEIVAVSLATLAAQTVSGRLGAPDGTGSLAISFVIITAFAVSISLLGHATIVQVQRWFTVAFGLLTVAFIGIEMGKVEWHKVAVLPQGRLVGGLLGGLSVIMAGTGLTWTTAAADYTRYLPRAASSARVVWWTVFGASLPLIILIGFGSLLAAGNPALALSANPVGTLTTPLPSWFLVLYLLTAVGGLVAEVVLSSYSGGLNLLTLGLRVPRYKSIVVDSVLLVAGSVYLLFFARAFFAPFEGFLVTVSVPLAAWSAIFLIDMWLLRGGGYAGGDLCDRGGRYRGVRWAAVAALVLATAAGWGLVTSTSPAFSWAGYLLRFAGGPGGAIGASSLGVILAFLLAGSCYAVVIHVQPQGRVEVSQAAGHAGP
jgi:nucleobase:cation symporter-1, NCS1 family